MGWTELLLRFAHIFFAILWMGLSMVFLFVIGPALMSLSPAERKPVQLQLLPRQGFIGALAGLGTVLTGFGLLHQVYLGAAGLGFANDRGYWMTAGTVLGLAVWVMSLTLILPKAKRLEALLKGEGDPSEIPALGMKMAKSARVVFFHGVGALACMAFAAHPLLPFSAANLALAVGVAVALAFATGLAAAKAAPRA